jgi:uroporphyrinogen decarboxylase
MVEGGTSKNFAELKKMMYSAPSLLHQLLDKLAETITLYLNAKIEAGAQVIQLFDTWAGELTPKAYAEFALPYEQKIFAGLKREGVPTIMYINGCGNILEQMATTGADVLSIDWRLNISDARRRLDAAGFANLALQGNLDPCILLGSKETIATSVREILDQAGGVGHIMNLGHGILPMVPVEHARTFIETVKNNS